MPSQSSFRTERGFTLIELLTVIAIIGILAAIVITTVGRVRESARSSVCASNLRQIGLAMMLYADDNRGNFPTAYVNAPGQNVTWNSKLNPYIISQAASSNPNAPQFDSSPVWDCPSAEKIKVNASDRYHLRHYGMNVMIREPQWNYIRARVPTPSRYILIGEINRNGEFVSGLNPTPDRTGSVDTTYRISHRNGTGSNYAFADGHVEFRAGALTDAAAATSPWRWWQ